jgi:hypothetical protein
MGRLYLVHTDSKTSITTVLSQHSLTPAVIAQLRRFKVSNFLDTRADEVDTTVSSAASTHKPISSYVTSEEKSAFFFASSPLQKPFFEIRS